MAYFKLPPCCLSTYSSQLHSSSARTNKHNKLGTHGACPSLCPKCCFLHNLTWKRQRRNKNWLVPFTSKQPSSPRSGLEQPFATVDRFPRENKMGHTVCRKNSTTGEYTRANFKGSFTFFPSCHCSLRAQKCYGSVPIDLTPASTAHLLLQRGGKLPELIWINHLREHT